jgi:hypothetical protein
MKTHNPDNERIKRAYFTYLTEAQGFSVPTLDAVAKAINRFGTYTRFRDFETFRLFWARPPRPSASAMPPKRLSYSITSSTRASSIGGTSIPSTLTVLILMASSNLVGCWTGRSAAFSPLRIRPV